MKLALAQAAVAGCILLGAAMLGTFIEAVMGTYQIEVLDSRGELYVIGRGSTCGEAWRNHGPIAKDWVEVACR